MGYGPGELQALKRSLALDNRKYWMRELGRYGAPFDFPGAADRAPTDKTFTEP